MKRLLRSAVTFTSLSLILFVMSCSNKRTKTPVDFINPFIGTDAHGHTYPGATVPFGMVQLSPDTRKDSWDGCSGYHYSDSVVFGFSHTHLSGTGASDYGDIRFMPTIGELKTDPGTAEDPSSGYASRFEHKREKAKAGFYAVHLNDYNIYVGLTVTERAGFHKYLFPLSKDAHIVIDLEESINTERIIESGIRIISDYQIEGLRRTEGWAKDQYVYFYAEFSKPFKSFGLVNDEGVMKEEDEAKSKEGGLKAWVDFETESGEIIYVKVGISSVDARGARNNLLHEIPDWDFERVKGDARDKWSAQMDKVEVIGNNDARKETFYTALYHTMLAPNVYTDVDGRYRGHDLKIHQDNTFQMYTVFSLWDTFRTLHPLFNIIERERTVDFIKSMLDMYKHDGLLPVWELAANETNTMIGYHAVPVIVDAYKKGINDFDAQMALDAMVQTSQASQFGLDWYRRKGYIPSDKEGESVSKSLEYAYDDWCIAEMAKMIGNEEVYKKYIRRAQFYKNHFDKETGFFRGKSNGSFVEPFDPAEVNFMFTEANSWQYNFFVPQDLNTHIDLLGGAENYEKKLDELFTSDSTLTGREQADITGLIGQYAQGNEPSHHMAYLYNYIGKPWKSQEVVNQIMNELYTNLPDGLSGNEDCGQLSAWYVMSAMGFYPVTPGSDVYVLGTPSFDSVTINLENEKKFKIKTGNLTDDNFYIQAVSYNGEPWPRSYITHDMIMNGGVLEFEMGEVPNKEFGKKVEHRPRQKISEHLITPVPYFIAGSKTFENQISVGIDHLNDDADVRWGRKTNEDEPNLRTYRQPLKLKKNTTLVAVANLNGKSSFFEESEYVKIPPGRTVQLEYPYNSQYAAGGEKALINTLRGGADFKTGNWQGYWGDDLLATIDISKAYRISQIGSGFLQDQNSWIFMPGWVKFEISIDGKEFTEVGTIHNDVDEKADGSIMKDFVITFKKQKVRYIRVHAKNITKCPAWHKGHPNPSWIFVDEVWWE